MRGGLRLSQHGVVVSEMRLRPGPTHSVFDVLAALAVTLHPGGRLGMLGFAGGGMMAPLRRLGFAGLVEAVDLDPEGHRLFRRHCAGWAGALEWTRADAVAWLEGQRERFGLLVEDLSVPVGGDVFKPEVSWTVMPERIRDRLVAGGVAIFNLIPSGDGTMPRGVGEIGALLGGAVEVELEEFENRILVCGVGLPTARGVASRLGRALRRLGSRQAGRVWVRGVKETSGGT